MESLITAEILVLVVTCDGCGLFPGSRVLSASESVVGLGYFKEHDSASLEYMGPRMHLSCHPSLPLCFACMYAVRHDALAVLSFQQTHGHVRLPPSTALPCQSAILDCGGLDVNSDPFSSCLILETWDLFFPV